MKRIATLLLAIVMLVSVMAPASVFAAGTTNFLSFIYDSTNCPGLQSAAGTLGEGEYIISITSSLTYNSAHDNVGSLFAVPQTGTYHEILAVEGVTSDWRATSKDTNSMNSNNYGGPFSDGRSTLFVAAKDSAMRFKTNGEIKGDYEVFYWFLNNGSSNINAIDVTVKGKKDYDTVNVASTASGKFWQTVGSYSFTGSEDEYVQIAKPGNCNGSLRLSAIKLVPTEIAEPVYEVVSITDKSDETVFATPADWNAANSVVSTTANNSSITFNPKNDLNKGFYKVNFYHTPNGDAVTAPTVKFELYNGDDTVKSTQYYNTGDGSLPATAVNLDLGTYQLEGDAYLKVTKVGGTAALNASQVEFTPISTFTEVAPVRADGVYKYQPDITGDRADTRLENDNYRNFVGEYTYVTEEAGAYQGYSARSFLNYNGTISEGYYDVYWYAIVDANSAGATDVDAYIYHNGVQEHVNLGYDKLTDGTKKWIKLGTYKFNGAYSDEYVSVGSKSVAALPLGGVKFVPAEVPEEATEIIVTVADDDYVEHDKGGWDESGSIRYGSINSRYVNGAGYSATFKATALSEGEWNVYYYHMPFWRAATSNCTDSTAASFIVKHNDKTDGQIYDGTEDAAAGNPNFGWKYMGSYDFKGKSADEGVTVMNLDGGKSMRTAAVKFVKKETVKEFIVPAVKNVEANNFSITADSTEYQPSISDLGTLTYEGLLSSAYALVETPANGKQTSQAKVRFYLPDHGINTAAGKYAVYTIALPFSKNNATQFNVNVSHNNNITPKTFYHYGEDGTNTTYGWSPIGEFDFLGGSNGEYVEFDLNETGKSTRINAVKFELIEAAADSEEETPDYTNSIVCDVDYNNGISEITGSTDAQRIAFTAKVTNGYETDYAKTPDVYVAVYDAAGTTLLDITKLETSSVNIKAGKTAWYTGYMSRQYSAGEKLVAYVWDTDLTPLSATFPINVVAAPVVEE